MSLSYKSNPIALKQATEAGRDAACLFRSNAGKNLQLSKKLAERVLIEQCPMGFEDIAADAFNKEIEPMAIASVIDASQGGNKEITVWVRELWLADLPKERLKVLLDWLKQQDMKGTYFCAAVEREIDKRQVENLKRTQISHFNEHRLRYQ